MDVARRRKVFFYRAVVLVFLVFCLVVGLWIIFNDL